MKKKFILLLTSISFLIFSCASTDVEIAPTEPDSPVISDTTDTSDSEQPVQDEKDSESPDSIENLPEISGQDAAQYELPQDFEEPEVQDLELPQEDAENEDTTESEDTQADIIEEPISSDEIELEPVETDYPYSNEDDLLNTQEDIPELPDESVNQEESENPADDSENPAEDSDETEGMAEEMQEDTSAEDENAVEEEDTDSDAEDDTYEQEIENPEVESEELIIMPSRSVTLKRGESLEVVYPGSGWIYMGSLSEYNNLASRGRKLGATDTKYTLLAKEAGTQIHHFYKVDNLTGEYIDDYLEVIVLDKKGSSKTTVKAPEYQYIIPPKPESPAKASVSEKDNSTETITTIIENTEESEDSEQPETVTDTAVIEETNDPTLVPEDLSNSVSSDSFSAASNDDFSSSYDDVISIDDDYSNYSEESTLVNAIDTDSLLENAKNLYNEEKYHHRKYYNYLEYIN